MQLKDYGELKKDIRSKQRDIVDPTMWVLRTVVGLSLRVISDFTGVSRNELANISIIGSQHTPQIREFTLNVRSYLNYIYTRNQYQTKHINHMRGLIDHITPDNSQRYLIDFSTPDRRLQILHQLKQHVTGAIFREKKNLDTLPGLTHKQKELISELSRLIK